MGEKKHRNKKHRNKKYEDRLQTGGQEKGIRESLKDILGRGLEHYPKSEMEGMIREIMEGMSRGSKLETYRDTVFRMLFQDKDKLLSLYNALNGSHYTDPNELIITTLDHAIYLGMKNDLAFVLMSELYLFEQQATFNRNMPLRMLFYVADTLRQLIPHRQFYRKSQIKIPTPHFITFYNGNENMDEDEIELRLSDAFAVKRENVELELTVRVININRGHNEKLMEACESLKGYMELTEAVRRYFNEEKNIDKAVVRAVDYCLENGYLVEFLTEYRNEVIAMWIKEYTFEDYKEDMEEERKELVRRVGELENRNGELENRNGELENRNDELENRNGELENRNDELENQNSELLRELNALKKQLAANGK